MFGFLKLIYGCNLKQFWMLPCPPVSWEPLSNTVRFSKLFCLGQANINHQPSSDFHFSVVFPFLLVMGLEGEASLLGQKSLISSFYLVCHFMYFTLLLQLEFWLEYSRLNNCLLLGWFYYSRSIPQSTPHPTPHFIFYIPACLFGRVCKEWVWFQEFSYQMCLGPKQSG